MAVEAGQIGSGESNLQKPERDRGGPDRCQKVLRNLDSKCSSAHPQGQVRGGAKPPIRGNSFQSVIVDPPEIELEKVPEQDETEAMIEHRVGTEERRHIGGRDLPQWPPRRVRALVGFFPGSVGGSLGSAAQLAV
jgi:hypothetical protein